MYGLLCVERERGGEGYVRSLDTNINICAHDGDLQQQMSKDTGHSQEALE